MSFNIKHTTRERWVMLHIPLSYFDGRCEAQRNSAGHVSNIRPNYRCRNNAVAINQGYAVCWRHRDVRDFFVDPEARAFREAR